ncbi:hypothetical protein Taro_042469 [Colocasia esculenta]|uniref:Uncharacterized protein n=1 Tax=Colocasia esculenta TaxID=4460 RepID=A0A843WZM5_COLES|nr:hypothetical protein [Colocasia esculenta]
MKTSRSVSTCPGGGVDTLSKIWKMLFWEEGPVSTCSGSVSTCCPNSSNCLFWELGLVSTCSESVSTWEAHQKMWMVGMRVVERNEEAEVREGHEKECHPQLGLEAVPHLQEGDPLDLGAGPLQLEAVPLVLGADPLEPEAGPPKLGVVPLDLEAVPPELEGPQPQLALF